MSCVVARIKHLGLNVNRTTAGELNIQGTTSADNFPFFPIYASPNHGNPGSDISGCTAPSPITMETSLCHIKKTVIKVKSLDLSWTSDQAKIFVDVSKSLGRFLNQLHSCSQYKIMSTVMSKHFWYENQLDSSVCIVYTGLVIQDDSLIIPRHLRLRDMYLKDILYYIPTRFTSTELKN
jgi:hypothetical protein